MRPSPMRLIASFGLVVLSLLTGAARAASHAKQCRHECGGLIAACAARNQDVGGLQSACKAAVLKRCRKVGPAVCLLMVGTTSTTTSTTTTTTMRRFTDNGNGTVTDHATGLQWEQKDNLDGSPNAADPHDADNTYTWTTTVDKRPNGTAFTDFLFNLNGKSNDGKTLTGCFADHCDWRLPTLLELQTILLGPYPCGTSPCIAPVFGPTVANIYWSATTFGFPNNGWGVSFLNGYVGYADSANVLNSVRAVRAGP